MTKRTVIDQAMCDHVRILLAGGAKGEQAAEIVGVGETTISRIKKAGFNAEVYQQNTEKRRKPAEEQEQKKEEEPMLGQICMELPELQQKTDNDVKMMRFQAAQVDKICMKLEKINDTLSMVLRATRGGE